MRNIAAGEVPRLRGRGLADADGGCGYDGAIDVITGYAAVAARSLDAGRIDVVLEQRAFDGWAEP